MARFVLAVSRKGSKDSNKYPKSLPAGHTIITHGRSKVRFVMLPDGRTLIPNQGVNDYKTDADLIENFYAWQARKREESGGGTSAKPKTSVKPTSNIDLSDCCNARVKADQDDGTLYCYECHKKCGIIPAVPSESDIRAKEIWALLKSDAAFKIEKGGHAYDVRVTHVKSGIGYKVFMLGRVTLYRDSGGGGYKQIADNIATPAAVVSAINKDAASTKKSTQGGGMSAKPSGGAAVAPLFTVDTDGEDIWVVVRKSDMTALKSQMAAFFTLPKWHESTTSKTAFFASMKRGFNTVDLVRASLKAAFPKATIKVL